MIRALEFSLAGEATARPCALGELGPPAEGFARWVDLEAQDDAQLAVLRERFNLHPLAIEDCAHFDQRPKLEDYEGHTFVVTHGVETVGASSGVRVVELHAFLAAGWLITVHTDPLPRLEAVWDKVRNDPTLARRGVDFLYYLVADSLVDGTFPVIELIGDALDTLEEEIVADHAVEARSRMFQLKRSLVTLRHIASPQREVFAALARRTDGIVSPRNAPYFRDVYDHLVRIAEAIDATRDLLGNVLDAHLALMSNRTNEIMKRLTIMSAIFLPLTFVTGFFGQNFDHLPFHSDRLMWTMIVACGALPTGMLWWFRRSQWW